jgi:hypothetical protein
MNTYFEALPEDILTIILSYTPSCKAIPDVLEELLSDDYKWSNLIFMRYPYLRELCYGDKTDTTCSSELELDKKTYENLLFLDCYNDRNISIIESPYPIRDYLTKPTLGQLNEERRRRKWSVSTSNDIIQLLDILQYLMLKKHYPHVVKKFNENKIVIISPESLYNFLHLLTIELSSFVHIGSLQNQLIKYIKTGIWNVSYTLTTNELFNLFGMISDIHKGSIDAYYLNEIIACIMLEPNFNKNIPNIEELVDQIEGYLEGVEQDEALNKFREIYGASTTEEEFIDIDFNERFY